MWCAGAFLTLERLQRQGPLLPYKWIPGDGEGSAHKHAFHTQHRKSGPYASLCYVLPPSGHCPCPCHPRPGTDNRGSPVPRAQGHYPDWLVLSPLTHSFQGSHSTNCCPRFPWLPLLPAQLWCFLRRPCQVWHVPPLENGVNQTWWPHCAWIIMMPMFKNTHSLCQPKEPLPTHPGLPGGLPGTWCSVTSIVSDSLWPHGL